MKNIIQISIAIVLFNFCSAPSDEHTAEENYSLIEMTTEEIKAMGIELGTISEQMVYQEIECIGVVDVPPQNLASVHTKIDGYAKEVKFLPGDYVKKGELMLVLEHPGFIQKQQQMLELKSRLAFLKAEFDRKKELHEQEASSLKQLQQAESEYLSVNSTYQGTKAELNMIGFNVNKIEEVQQPQTRLELRSPISGYITQMKVNLGKLVMTNDLLYEIVDRDHLHVELQVYAKDVPLINEGDTLHVKFPGKSKIYIASVYLIGKQIDQESRTTSVHAHLINESEERELVLGSVFQANIFSQGSKKLTLPLSAAVKEGNKYFFFKETEGGFEKVLLNTGKLSDQLIEIINPNAELLKTRFVTKGTYYLQGSTMTFEDDH